jgi:dTDP-4-dehydrorhamnose reductase
MRVLIIGGNGMLGHQLCRVLSRRMDVWATVKEEPTAYAAYSFLPGDHLAGQINIQDLTSLRRVLNDVRPQVVINAAGIVKQRDEAKQAVPSIQVNALFPHQLADLCGEYGIRVVQVSTDCVFSGQKGNYSEVDNPDPMDLYGRSKLLGELNRPGCLTIRASIIGWQLSRFSSLLSWFAAQRGQRIKGYRQAIYSGFSTSVMAVLIGDLIETRPDLQGIYHVASAPISKYDLLVKLRDALGWNDIGIDADEQFFCDRSLDGMRFSTATGWRPPGWDDMIAGLASEWVDYAGCYQTS